MAAQSRSDRRSNTVQREWLRSRRKKETGKRKKRYTQADPYNGNGLWLKSSALTNLFVGSRSANRAGRRRLVNKTPRRRWKAIISERLAANPVETIYLRRSWKNRWSITAVTIAPPRPGTPIISALRQHRHILSIHPDSIWFTRAYPEREREAEEEEKRASLWIRLLGILPLCASHEFRYNHAMLSCPLGDYLSAAHEVAETIKDDFILLSNYHRPQAIRLNFASCRQRSATSFKRKICYYSWKFFH